MSTVGEPLKAMTQRDQSPKLASKFLKYSERPENQAKEDLHRKLVKGEMQIQKDNSQKRLIAALIQPHK